MYFHLIIAAVLLFAAPALAAESNTDRGGSDYRSFQLSQPDYQQCEQSCNADAQCKAWTYVKPGVQGSNAVCWLKHSVPAARASNCCISGVTDNPSRATNNPSGITVNKSRQAMETPPASLANPRAWINAWCAETYRLYILTTEGHILGGTRKGVFVAGYDPNTAKYHCFAGNTFGHIAKTEGAEIALCRRTLSHNFSSCQVLGYWRYE